MATHSSVLAWRIPGTAEPGGLPSVGSHRVGHDWSDLATVAAAAYFTHSFLCRKCESESVSPSVLSDSATPWTVAQQAPYSWNSTGKNTGEGCHSLFQGIKPRSPALQADSLPSEPPEKSFLCYTLYFILLRLYHIPSSRFFAILYSKVIKSHRNILMVI